MNRFIVVNPEAGVIQGDIMCASASAAVSRLETGLSSGTENASWDVYAAPSAFPAPGVAYSGLDSNLVTLLSSVRPVLNAPNGRRVEAAAGLALAC